MGAVNTDVIAIVEVILLDKGQLSDNDAFSKLMDDLMFRTEQFWKEHKDVIPARYHVYFRKYA